MDQTLQAFLLDFATELDNLSKTLGVTAKSTHYCMGCKASKQPDNVQETTMSNGRRAEKGQCPDCGRKTFRLLPNK